MTPDLPFKGPVVKSLT